MFGSLLLSFKYDLLINPSHHEGFSRVLLEGAYVGLYCIANDIPGTRNIIKNCKQLFKSDRDHLPPQSAGKNGRLGIFAQVRR